VQRTSDLQVRTDTIRRHLLPQSEIYGIGSLISIPNIGYGHDYVGRGRYRSVGDECHTRGQD
jgi:hypothetical protein